MVFARRFSENMEIRKISLIYHSNKSGYLTIITYKYLIQFYSEVKPKILSTYGQKKALLLRRAANNNSIF